MTMTQSEPRCRRCGADALASKGHFERTLRLGREPEVTSQLLRLCGPCSRDLASDEIRLEYLRLGALV
jgi:hypothetical protein